MERLSDEAQWIIMIAFLVSIAMFFLALVINQSTLVGQTTAEGVLEFPKNDIQDLRTEIFAMSERWPETWITATPSKQVEMLNLYNDTVSLALARKNAVVDFEMNDISSATDQRPIAIYYNNGVTIYNETISY